MPDIVWIENVLFPIFGMGMGAFFLFGVYRTVNRWIERRHEREMRLQGGGASPQELEDLRARVAALEEGAERVQELEERVDFTERVLARERERPALDDGH